MYWFIALVAFGFVVFMTIIFVRAVVVESIRIASVALYQDIGSPTRFVPISGRDFDAWVYSSARYKQFQEAGLQESVLTKITLLKYLYITFHLIVLLALVGLFCF